MAGAGIKRFAGRVVRWLRPAAVAYLLALLTLMFFEERLIFFPRPYPQGEWQPAGLAIEDAWTKSADGVSIHGWYLEHPDPRAVVLFAHGNAGNITGRDDVLRDLHALGASALVFDYRGYGRSAGTPHEAGILADARAARTWLAQRGDRRKPDRAGRRIAGGWRAGGSCGRRRCAGADPAEHL